GWQNDRASGKRRPGAVSHREDCDRLDRKMARRRAFRSAERRQAVRLLRVAIPAFACTLLFACTSTPRTPAPVFDRPVTRTLPAKPAAQKPDSYTVKRGDTLYSIALDNGVDYRDVAAWNNLADPSVLKEGTVLRLRPPPPQAQVQTEARQA